MIRKFSVPWAVILVFLSCSTARAQVSSLIVNGSFEDGPTVGSFVNPPAGSQALPGP